MCVCVLHSEVLSDKLFRSDEYTLDLKEKERLIKERDAAVQQLREEIDMQILAQQFLRHQIKTECWDAMETVSEKRKMGFRRKIFCVCVCVCVCVLVCYVYINISLLININTQVGRTVYSIGEKLEVSNYPLAKRTDKQLDELKRVTLIRKIELGGVLACCSIVFIFLSASHSYIITFYCEQRRKHESRDTQWPCCPRAPFLPQRAISCNNNNNSSSSSSNKTRSNSSNSHSRRSRVPCPSW